MAGEVKLIFSLAVGFSFHWPAVVNRGGSIVVLHYVAITVGWPCNIYIRVDQQTGSYRQSAVPSDFLQLRG